MIVSQTMSSYRLELCPTEKGRTYYKSCVYETNENAGIDLYVADDYEWKTVLTNAKPTLLSLGCSARLVRLQPDGSEEEVHYWLCPRSSIIKTGMMMANSQGVIDRSYRGELKAPVWVVSPLTFTASFTTAEFKGSRFFQIVAPDMGWIREVRVVDSLNETARGSGGFGSTGTQ
jgi:dUTP pyrophosphatase